MSLSNNTLLSF